MQPIKDLVINFNNAKEMRDKALQNRDDYKRAFRTWEENYGLAHQDYMRASRELARALKEIVPDEFGEVSPKWEPNVSSSTESR